MERWGEVGEKIEGKSVYCTKYTSRPLYDSFLLTIKFKDIYNIIQQCLHSAIDHLIGAQLYAFCDW